MPFTAPIRLDTRDQWLAHVYNISKTDGLSIVNNGLMRVLGVMRGFIPQPPAPEVPLDLTGFDWFEDAPRASAKTRQNERIFEKNLRRCGIDSGALYYAIGRAAVEHFLGGENANHEPAGI